MFDLLTIRKLSIFPKLILTFLLVILPFYALSLLLTESGKKEVQSQISAQMTSQVEYYFSSMEAEITRVIKTQQEYINDDDLQSLSTRASILTDYERIKAINRLYTKLRILRNSSVLIQDVSVYIPLIDRTIYASQSLSDDISKAEVMDMAEEIYSKGYPLSFWKGKLYLNLTYPMFRIAGKQPDFILNVELSIPQIKTVLGRFNADGGAVFFNDHWGIANEKDNQLLPPIRKLTSSERANGKNAFTSPADINGISYIISYQYSNALDAAVTVFVPEKLVLGKLQTYRTWVWLLTFCSAFIVILFSYGIYLLIQRPLRLLVKSFRSVEDGNFNIKIRHKREDEFGYLYRQFEQMLRNLKALIDESYVQKISLQQAELKQLQAQINPHFLYNSFFILHRLIKTYDIDRAEIVSKSLGDYFQYITRNAQNEVALEFEFRHTLSYVEIQHIRFGKRIETDIEELPDRYRHVPVPRLILQPLIENAYEYGLREVMSGGLLRLRFIAMPGRLCISVEDNGAGMEREAFEQLRGRLADSQGDAETSGLINVHRRLRLKYGRAAGIEVAGGAAGGLVVHMFIPVEEELR